MSKHHRPQQHAQQRPATEAVPSMDEPADKAELDMKRCALCGLTCPQTTITCPACGEASWS